MAEAEARVRELLKKLREEMRWLDVLRMLAAGGYPLLAREGFEEQINAVLAKTTDDDAEDSSVDAADEADEDCSVDAADDDSSVDDAGENSPVDGKALVRDILATFKLPAWLSADLALLEAWFLERAASDEAFFGDVPQQRTAEGADEFDREALAAMARIVEVMNELESLCTAAREPTGAFDFWQLHTWVGIILGGELATSERIGYAIGTTTELASLDRLARKKAREWSDQVERLTIEVVAEDRWSDDELHAEVNRRWADPAVRERLSRVTRPRTGSVVIMPPPDER